MCVNLSIRAGWGWGDPHFDSLDGLRYTFNGWGEYVLYKLLDSDQEQFAVQARTQPVNASDSTAATLLSAIAAGIPNTSYAEVSQIYAAIDSEVDIHNANLYCLVRFSAIMRSTYVFYRYVIMKLLNSSLFSTMALIYPTSC